jgi:uncharacterized protein (DUF1778 family)
MYRHLVYKKTVGRKTREGEVVADIDQRNRIRSLPISIRANRRHRDLIDRAARVLGKSRSEFMLEAACREAEDVLFDQRDFRLGPEAFERFAALLDRPPPPTDALRRLLVRIASWE